MELVLIRHGEPARDLREGDSADPWLSPEGRAQAIQAGRALALEKVAALYTSPMRRATETADIIGTAICLEPRLDDGLAEFDRGARYLHFEDEDPAQGAYARYLQHDDLTLWGTDVETFRAQVNAAFERVISAHPGQSVVVVSHGGVANAYLGSVLGVSRLHFHEPQYGSISRVRASRSGVRTLVSVNETAHLKTPLCPDPSLHEAALEKKAG